MLRARYGKIILLNSKTLAHEGGSEGKDRDSTRGSAMACMRAAPRSALLSRDARARFRHHRSRQNRPRKHVRKHMKTANECLSVRQPTRPTALSVGSSRGWSNRPNLQYFCQDESVFVVISLRVACRASVGVMSDTYPPRQVRRYTW